MTNRNRIEGRRSGVTRLTGSPEEAQAALALVREWVVENGLVLHPSCRRRVFDATKTHVGGRVEDARLRHDRIPGQGFEFLGYRFEAGRRLVRKKSLKKLKDSIRAKTGRARGVSLECAIADLNPVLRGWFGYFKQAHPTTFADVDGFIRRRLRSMLLKHKKRSHIGFGTLIHRTWPHAFFAKAGLFALHTAWQTARQSR